MVSNDEGSISYEAAQDVIRTLAAAGLCTNCGSSDTYETPEGDGDVVINGQVFAHYECGECGGDFDGGPV